MRRRTFDLLLTWVGVLLTVGLLGAGALLLVGYNFDNSSVHNQLAKEKVYFPTATELKGMPSEITAFLSPYAGQQVVNGRQAEVFADHYIAVHLKELAGGKTYSQLSATCLANPSDTATCNAATKYFQGDTLRGLLLNAYAFWTFGVIAMYSSIACFVLGLLMLLFTLLGFRHYRVADPSETL